VGFVPGSSLVLVVSHQGRGVVDFISDERVASDRQGNGFLFDIAQHAVLGIGPVDGRWIEVADLAGGRLAVTTADGWRAVRTADGVVLLGTAGKTVELCEAEEIRAFGFSPDGQVFIIASSPSLTTFRRTVSDYMFYSWQHKPHSAQECCLIGPALSLVGSGLFASRRDRCLSGDREADLRMLGTMTNQVTSAPRPILATWACSGQPGYGSGTVAAGIQRLPLDYLNGRPRAPSPRF
jgi:hypothetical protein